MKTGGIPPLASNHQRTDHLVGFFVGTFALSWVCFAIAANVFAREASIARGVVLFLGIFAPALVAFCLVAGSEGKQGVLALLSGIIRWRVGIRWYLFAVFYVPVMKLLNAVIYRLGMGEWPRFSSEPWFVLAIATIFSTPVQAGEEIGWRGYALPRLATRMGYARGSVILGLIWASWHLPLFFLQGADKYGQSFWVYLVQVTALSVTVAWLFVHTNGSLLVCMLMHSAANQSVGIVSSVTAPGANPFTSVGSTVAWLTAALLWIGGIYFILDMVKRRPNQSMELTASRRTAQFLR